MKIKNNLFSKGGILMGWPTHIVAAAGYIFDKAGILRRI
jgi:hypothetical protein